VVRGLTLAVTWWSAAGALTALVRGPVSLAVCRALLAVGAGGAWPSFAKAVALWVPPQGRALAIGACNSGSSIGSLLTPPLAAFLALMLGWRAAFAIIGAIGLVWVAAFLGFARAHPGMLATDRGLHAQHGRSQVRWVSLLGYRQTWAVFFCRFFADSAWYFYVYWIPEFLARERGLDLAAIGAVAGLPFLVSTVSNFATGYAALRLQRAGWSVNRARKTLMFAGMALSSVGIAAVFAHSLFWTMTLLSAGVFFWMCWSATVHTLPGEFFPPYAVASVYGFGGTGSTLGSVISTWAVGRTLDLTGSYVPVFIGIGLMTPVAFVVGTALMGRIQPVRMKEA
jgi:ACS family hexuronate transporter-like MFS transporter